MFTTIFTFALVTTYAAAEIPSYIQVCGRKNPKLGECIKDSINNLRGQICKGIPELNSPPLEPLIIDNIVISDKNNAKMFLKDSKITGLCDLTVNSFHMDIDKLHFEADVSFKQAYLNGTYDFDIRILVPFIHKGPVYITADDLVTKIAVDLKLITKNDKRYVYMSKINLTLDIKKINSKFDANEQELVQLNEIISSFVGSNEQEFINRIKPSIEAEVSKKILSLGNNIVKNFSYDELFPERE